MSTRKIKITPEIIHQYTEENFPTFKTEDNEVILAYGDFKYLMTHHYEKNMLVFDDELSDFVLFNNRWSHFVIINRGRIAKMYGALVLDYEPLQNYDKTSTITKQSDDTFGAHTNNTTDSVSAFNTETFSNANKSSSSYGQQLDEHKEEITEHTYGNIGVTTSQQMAQSEIELRKFNIRKYLVDEFAHENLFFS